MKIIPVEDTYTMNNGGPSNNNFFLIKNFRDNKDDLKRLFRYVEDSIKPVLPFNKNTHLCYFIFCKGDVSFDDGVYYINTKKFIKIFFYNEPPNYFRSTRIFFNKHKAGKSSYTLGGEEEVVIFMNYNELNTAKLQEFLDIVTEQRLKTAMPHQEYRLINVNTMQLDGTVKYNGKETFELFIH